MSIIRQLREASGMTQKQCATAAGAKVQTWQKWEYHPEKMLVSTLVRVAKVFRVPPGDILLAIVVQEVAKARDRARNRRKRPVNVRTLAQEGMKP